MPKAFAVAGYQARAASSSRRHPEPRAECHGIVSAAPSLCLACGRVIAATLQHVASLRCHDCRATEAPLRRDLVEGRGIERRKPRAA